MDVLSATLLVILGVMLIGIVLLQRGRGGGLAGAFGGLGGQSAFGTKAGDTFTRITIVLASLWVLLAGLSGLAFRSHANTSPYTGESEASQPASEDPEVPSVSSGDDTDKPEDNETPKDTDENTSDENATNNESTDTDNSDESPEDKSSENSTSP